MAKISVIGGGAWGTALATVARRAGHDTLLWAREAEVVDAINARHRNEIFLPDIDLDPDITATADIAEAAADADTVLLVAPAQHLRAVAATMANHVKNETPVAICAKGIEIATGALMSEALAVSLPGQPFAVLSGPTFASEVARGLPAAVTLAADGALAEMLADMLGSPHFRPYVSHDPTGAQIGGAVKNVIAIGCGIVAGRGLGENARAALITRGLAEMTRFCVAKGGEAETMMGLSGLGDLTLTCNSMQSRNMSLGHAIGEGRTLQDIMKDRKSVAEGVHSAEAIYKLSRRLKIDMPITTAVHAILHEGADLDEVIEGLMSRPFRAEEID